MSLAPGQRDAFTAILRRDALLFWSYKLRVVAQSLNIFLSLVLFYYVSRLVSVGEFGSPDEYFAFVVVGLAVLAVLTATLAGLPLAIRQELVAGTFERIVVSPLGGRDGIVAMSVWPFCYATVLSATQILLAVIVFGLDLRWSTAALAFPVMALGSLSFLPFALLVAAVVLTLKQAGGALTFVTTGISFVGGFLFPVALLPGWIQWVSEVQPFSPTLELLRHLLIGADLPDPAWQAVLKLVAFAAVLIPVAAWLLDRAIESCRRRGTLTEY